MKLGLLALFTAGGMAVWVFAVIGVMAVAHAVSEPPAAQERALLEQPADVEGHDLAGLPRPADATRVEFRDAVWGDSVVYEVEYHTSRSVESICEYYEDAFAEDGWTLEDETYERGERTYHISSGATEATVEIEGIDGRTEIEIELVERLAPRGSWSAR